MATQRSKWRNLCIILLSYIYIRVFFIVKTLKVKRLKHAKNVTRIKKLLHFLKKLSAVCDWLQLITTAVLGHWTVDWWVCIHDTFDVSLITQGSCRHSWIRGWGKWDKRLLRSMGVALTAHHYVTSPHLIWAERNWTRSVLWSVLLTCSSCETDKTAGRRNSAWCRQGLGCAAKLRIVFNSQCVRLY